MISERQLPELRVYLDVEKSTRLRDSKRYVGLVAPGGNETYPVHGWLRFKEAFSADLLRVVVRELASDLGKSFRLLDPFCGVGTSLVASQEMTAEGWDIQAQGIEISPFIGFAARTKVRWPRMAAQRIVDGGESALRASTRDVLQLPPVSSIAKGVCITRHTARRLLEVRKAVADQDLGVDGDALLLGLAASIESLSRVRKDGRALRIVERKKPAINVALRERWERISGDAQFFQDALPRARIPRVVRGDGRNPLNHGVPPGSIDLIVTSPPYPNTIDYTEVYKLELWMLGLVDNGAEFLKLRRSTFRSHPTTPPAEQPEAFLKAARKGRLKTLLSPLFERTRSSQEKWRNRLLTGYFSDMWTALIEHHKCLRPGGFEIIVVGNSLHGGRSAPYLIPTDLVVAIIAERCGFRVRAVEVARQLPRRLSGNHFLRESVVVLRKP